MEKTSCRKNLVAIRIHSGPELFEPARAAARPMRTTIGLLSGGRSRKLDQDTDATLLAGPTWLAKAIALGDECTRKMSDDPEALETYARIFEMRRTGTATDSKGRVAKIDVPPSEACLAAARALRFMAGALRADDQ